METNQPMVQPNNTMKRDWDISTFRERLKWTNILEPVFMQEFAYQYTEHGHLVGLIHWATKSS